MAQNIDVRNSLIVPLGFGDYPLPEGKSFDQMQIAAKVQRIAYAILFGILAVCSVVLTHVSIPLSVLMIGGFTAFMIRKILEVMGVANRAPPTGQLFPPERIAMLPKLGEVSDIPCSGFPTKNGPDSQVWKEELIRSARHSIVMSGCYCGDKVFDRTLDLMKERLDAVDALTITILCSNVMLTEENHEHLDQMRKQYPSRFTCITMPEIFPFLSPTTGEFSISSNHTKALVIDYGAFFMLGGTGIAHCFAEQVGIEEPTNLEPKSGCVDKALDSILKMRAFRDMDFVFRSEMNGIGTRLYVEMSKLIERMRFRRDGDWERPEANWPVHVETNSLAFAEKESLSDGMRVACYATGPEQESNIFLDEMVARVDAAESSIVVDNLYFHPPEPLMEAFRRAIKRGVKLTILTNTSGSKSPGSHSLYADRSGYHSRSLFDGQPNPCIELFEFSVPYTSLHKKVMVIDAKYTLLGSANMGKKSLENMDYEANLKIDSEAFAQQVLLSIEEDKSICERVPDEEAYKISFFTKVAATIQAIPMYFA